MSQRLQFSLLRLLGTVGLICAAVAFGSIGFEDGNEKLILIIASVVAFSSACGNLVGHALIGAIIGLGSFAGGLACGWCVSHLGELGALSLAACGALAGNLWRRVARTPSKLAGASLAIATMLAYFVAETCWLHWNTRNGEPSWWAAISIWPLFLREYTIAASIGMVCAAYGAWSAYGSALAGDSSRATHEVVGPPPP